MTRAEDITGIYSMYLNTVQEVPLPTNIITEEVSEPNKFGEVKKINIFIKTSSGTIENRYSAAVPPESISIMSGTITIIGTDSKLDKSIQVVISSDNPTSVIVQGTEGDHPDLIRFEDDLSFFQRDNPQELNIFINE
jgi:hypothetical protein